MLVANARKCDTKYIEERVYTLCRGLVSTCVVVGTEKPAPALVVEPTPVNLTEKELIQQLSERLASINEGGYSHERLPDRNAMDLGSEQSIQSKRTTNSNKRDCVVELSEEVSKSALTGTIFRATLGFNTV